MVTYRYTELSESACPRFPRYIGLRLDLNWVNDSLYLIFMMKCRPLCYLLCSLFNALAYALCSIRGD
jgi:hypothetical protein